MSTQYTGDFRSATGMFVIPGGFDDFKRGIASNGRKVGLSVKLLSSVLSISCETLEEYYRELDAANVNFLPQPNPASEIKFGTQTPSPAGQHHVGHTRTTNRGRPPRVRNLFAGPISGPPLRPGTTVRSTISKPIVTETQPETQPEIQGNQEAEEQ